MKTRLSALALALLLGGGAASAQKILVTGRVTNASKTVLPKVQVVVKETGRSMVTTEQGLYVLELEAGQTLQFILDGKVLKTLVATQPQLGLRREIIAALDAHLTAEKMRGEAAYFDRKLAGTFERTYGWAWLLQLSRQLHLLTRSEDAELRDKAKGWSQAVDILADKIVAKWKAYLPKMHYPNRIGTHSNSAFALGFALDYARERGDRDFEAALMAKARELYLGDKHIPAHLEPNATDFISPALMTADLMTRVLEPAEYRRWLSRYFTSEGLDRLCQPLVITDLTDYTIVHLLGLSFTRAWTMARVARALPLRDKLRQRLERMAPILYRQGMEQIFASGYGGDHWLASFARYADEVLQGKQ